VFDTSTWDKLLQERIAERERQRQHMLVKAVEALRRYFRTKKVKAVYLTGSILEEGKFLPESTSTWRWRGCRRKSTSSLLPIWDAFYTEMST